MAEPVFGRLPRLLVAVAAVLTLAGCGTAKHPAAGSSTSSSTPSASPSATPTPVLEPTAPANTRLGAGQRVWAAFAARGLSQKAWWARLAPMLSEAAKATYRYDDPRNIPAMKLTGKIRVSKKAPAAPKFTAQVVVPTNRGTFRLDLERHKVHDRWLLYGITFPPGVQ